MKILSVDFDFFQNIKRSDVAYYPDGIDRTPEESEEVWSECYKNYKKLHKITAKQAELKKLRTILNAQSTDIPVMIANSHKDIYDFIHRYQETDKPLNIVNIDTHHDMFNDNPKLDCGNWVGHLINEFDTHLIWIANPISCDVYGITKTGEEVNIPINLDKIISVKFDAVFLCRSDTWTPPHLDKHFSRICRDIKRHFTKIEIEKNIDRPRSA